MNTHTHTHTHAHTHTPDTAIVSLLVPEAAMMYSELGAGLTVTLHVYSPASLRLSTCMACSTVTTDPSTESLIFTRRPSAGTGPVSIRPTIVSVSTPVLAGVTTQLITRPVVPS